MSLTLSNFGINSFAPEGSPIDELNWLALVRVKPIISAFKPFTPDSLQNYKLGKIKKNISAACTPQQLSNEWSD